MDKVINIESFKSTLNALPLNQQRQLGAMFVGNVLDLADERCTRQAQAMAAKSDTTPEQLQMLYDAVHSIYVSTHPRSDLSELDYKKQAAHLVSEACMTCVGPTYGEYKTHHIAENAASYCRMARLCSSIDHGAGKPDLSSAEVALEKELHDQMDILNRYLEEAA